MLLFSTVCLIGIGMSLEVVEAAAKPSFNLFSKNPVYGFRPADDGPKNSVDGAGPWVRMPNPQSSNGNNQYESAEEMMKSMNYMTGMLTNSTLFDTGIGRPSEDVPKEAANQKYKMVYETEDHTKCEQCDGKGKTQGMIFVKNNGVKKIINYEAVIAKDPEEPTMNMIPSMLENPQNSGIGGQSDGPPSPFQYYSQLAPQMNERMAMPNNIPTMQLGQLPNAMPQPPVSPVTTQLSFTPQQNSMPYNMLAQVNSVLQNSANPQISSSMGTFTSQMPSSAPSNAANIRQQQMMYQRVAALVPSNNVDQQLVAQRVNQLMGANTNQQHESVTPLLSHQTWQTLPAGFLLLRPSPTRDDAQTMMVNLGGSQSSSAAATQSKEQAVELNPSDNSRTEETDVKKLVAELIGLIPKNEDSKDPSEQTAGRR